MCDGTPPGPGPTRENVPREEEDEEEEEGEREREREKDTISNTGPDPGGWSRAGTRDRLLPDCWHGGHDTGVSKKTHGVSIHRRRFFSLWFKGALSFHIQVDSNRRFSIVFVAFPSGVAVRRRLFVDDVPAHWELRSHRSRPGFRRSIRDPPRIPAIYLSCVLAPYASTSRLQPTPLDTLEVIVAPEQNQDTIARSLRGSLCSRFLLSPPPLSLSVSSMICRCFYRHIRV